MGAALDHALAACDERAERLVQDEVERIALHYARARDLPNLLPDAGTLAEADILPALRRALASEAHRLATGHWTNDGQITRALALRGAIVAEEGQRDRRLAVAYARTFDAILRGLT